MKEQIVKHLEGDQEIDLYVVDFGKNGQGITDELLLVGKRIEELSKVYNVYMHYDSFIDTADDVYTLKFVISSKNKRIEE